MRWMIGRSAVLAAELGDDEGEAISAGHWEKHTRPSHLAPYACDKLFLLSINLIINIPINTAEDT